MGAGMSSGSGRCANPPTYRLSSDGETIESVDNNKVMNMTPIVRIEKLRTYNFRTAFRQAIAWCSLSPGYQRYESIFQSIAELCRELYGSNNEFELRVESPVKPLGMVVGQTVKRSEFRRFDVTASIVRRDRFGKPLPSELETVMSTDVKDWRCFGSRKLTNEIRLKAVETLQKSLLEEKTRRVWKTQDLMEGEGGIEVKYGKQ